MAEIAATGPLPRTTQRAGFRRLMLFFALVYVAEGVCQSDGLIAQPLNY
jgi:hypothetical protein